MHFLRTYRKGLIGGFLFGTVGIFLLAALALLAAPLEMAAFPFLYPGRLFADLLGADTVMTNSDLIILYVCTGLLYAFIGLLIQLFARAVHRKGQK